MLSLRNAFVIIGLSLLFAIACSKPENKVESIDYTSFPLQVGHWTEYQVDSVKYDAFRHGQKTTSQTQMRELIARTAIDNTGKTYYQVERYRRTTESDDWQFDLLYKAQLTTTTAEVTEDNTKEIKLVFPIEEDLSWNGNAYNANEVWKYKYVSTAASFVVLGKTYNNALRVLQHESSNLIKKEYYEERYASGIGLIYKEALRDSSEDTTLSVPFDQRITGGIEVKISLIKYGN